MLSMFFPALPQDVPANVSLPLRRIAEQGLEAQAQYASGMAPKDVKDIDYMRGAADAMYYTLGPAGTIRTLSQSLGMAGKLARSGYGYAQQQGLPVPSNLPIQGYETPEQPGQPQDILPLR
jgi:hypothetical protein